MKKRSCECSFGYPATTNEDTGELECLETAFDEVLIDDDLTQAGFSTRCVFTLNNAYDMSHII